METPEQKLNTVPNVPNQSLLGFAMESNINNPTKSSLWVELLQNSKLHNDHEFDVKTDSTKKFSQTLGGILKDPVGMLFLKIFLQESGDFHSYNPKIEFLNHVTIFRCMNHSQSRVVFASKIFNKFFNHSKKNEKCNNENEETDGIEKTIANCQIAIDGIDEKYIDSLKVKLYIKLHF